MDDLAARVLLLAQHYTRLPMLVFLAPFKPFMALDNLNIFFCICDLYVILDKVNVTFL